MNSFTVALNSLLDRVKQASGTTRQSFAKQRDVPLSSLSNFTSGRQPDRATLGKLVKDLTEDDALRLIHARLRDEIPEDWQNRIQFSSEPALARPLPLAALLARLPDRTQLHFQQLATEALSNQQMIDYLREFVELLNLPEPKESERTRWERLENFRVQPTPAEPVHSKSPPGHSTRKPAQMRVAEDQPGETKKLGGPRTRSTRPGVRKTVSGSTRKTP